MPIDMRRDTHVLSELVRYKPRYGLIHDFRLQINPLDRQKDLAKSMGVHHIKLPFRGQP